MAKGGGKIRTGSIVHNSDLLPMAEKLAELGIPRKTIAFVLGLNGKAFAKLWDSSGDLRKAIESGEKLAQTDFIATIIKEAAGYDYKLKKTTYKYLDPTDEKPIRVKVGETIETRHQPANAALATFLACNLMPNDFRKETQIKIDKRTQSLIVGGDLGTEHLRKLAGSFMELADKQDKKQIESKEVENETKSRKS